MSFGKRGTGAPPPPVRESGPAPSAPPQPGGLRATLAGGQDEETESPMEIVLFVGTGAAVFTGILLLILYLVPKPLWQGKENAIYYSYTAMVQKQLITGKSLMDVDREMNKRFKFSLSDYMLTREPFEGSQFAAVRQECLDGKTIPDTMFAPQAYRVYTDVTLYVACMMEKRKERLCDASERDYLKRLLKGYSRYRQEVLGVERMLGEIAPTRMAKTALQRYIDTEADLRGGKRVDLDMSIGKKVDGRILSRLQKLVEEGYMSASDYSFMGWWLPADYAPAFINAKPQGALACG